MSFKSAALYILSLATATVARANVDNGQWIFHGPKGDKKFVLSGEVKGTPYVSLNQLASGFGLTVKKLSDSEIEITSQAKAFARISTQTSAVKASWSPVSNLSRAPVVSGSDWRVPIDFGDRILRPLVFGKIPPLPQSDKPLLEAEVLIDPGHGGNDYGTYRGNLKEKDLTLLLGRDLADALNRLSVATSLTRHQDLFLSLQERTQMAHRSRAKLFISIHLNFEPTSKSSGFELYVLSLDPNEGENLKAVATENQIIPRELPEGVERTLSDLRATANFEESLSYAKRAQAGLSRNLKAFGKAVKTAPFYVLYGVSMPALLIEFGFLNSQSDQKWIRDPKQRSKVIGHLAEELAKNLRAKKP